MYLFILACVTAKLISVKLEKEKIIPGIYIYVYLTYLYWFYMHTRAIFSGMADIECFAFFRYRLRRISIEKSR